MKIMTKNLIPEIAKMLGVEIGEEFEVKGITSSKYRFKNDGLEVNFWDGVWKQSILSISQLGDIEVMKLPFEPQMDERYYTFAGSWEITDTLWRNRPCDYGRKAINCVFRTQEEALKARPAKYKELTGAEMK